MGTWNADIFGNDLALDLKSGFREYIIDGKTPHEARLLLQKDFSIDANIEPREAHEFWLALSAIQHELGRLEEEVKQKSITIIDGGENIQDWAELGASPENLKKRKMVLLKLKETLLSSQPPAKQLKKPPQSITPYQIGDVMYYRHTNGKYYLFVVYQHSKGKNSLNAYMHLLDAVFYSKEQFINRKLDKIPLRHIQSDKTKRSNFLVGHWYGRLYNRLVKDDRIGLAGTYKLKKPRMRRKILGYKFYTSTLGKKCDKDCPVVFDTFETIEKHL
ncbi:MAG: hypothetical protein LBQ71_05990 [Hungatella sp.]|jgi:hypothetical protein|nr:hypothetical protein [Hungatella sp.]